MHPYYPSSKQWICVHVICCGLTFVTQLPGRAVAATLFSTCRNSAIYVFEETSAKRIATVPHETLVVGFQQVEYKGIRYCYVRCPSPKYQSGWIREEDVAVFRDLVKDETGAAERSRDGRDNTEGPDPTPLVIRQDRRTWLRKAWLELQDIIKDNDSLPLDKRRPEPYFARAELWTQVHNYPEAMRDYLSALHYASSSGRQLQSYARYNDKIHATIDQFTRIPAPPVGVSNNLLGTGWNHYSHGVSAFRLKNNQDAARHFQNAVSVVPDNPIYWYYRSVAVKRLGDEDQALFDVVYGAFVESNRQSPQYSQLITRELQHIQGPDRIWLEGFRLGDPSGKIIQTASGR